MAVCDNVAVYLYKHCNSSSLLLLQPSATAVALKDCLLKPKECRLLHRVMQDLFEHNAWVVRVLGMEGAERVKVVDFSAFYAKFGGEPDENDVTPPKEPQQSS
jgi:hypothetical protein